MNLEWYTYYNIIQYLTDDCRFMIFTTHKSPVRQGPSMSRSASEDVWKSARIPKSPTWPQTVLRKPASPILGCIIWWCIKMTCCLPCSGFGLSLGFFYSLICENNVLICITSLVRAKRTHSHKSLDERTTIQRKLIATMMVPTTLTTTATMTTRSWHIVYALKTK